MSNTIKKIGESLKRAGMLETAPLCLYFQDNVPADAVPGPTYARFRLSMNGGLSPIGLALNGEVEDYLAEIGAVNYGSITAHKFNDLNGNGIKDAGEPPLAGWTMTLYTGSSCSGQGIANGVTDASGNVTFPC